ncbi:Ca2+ regulator and membrane fusion protein Fig1-domain-containing protein [Colletotrichum godetiae]|uniref:Ca2+ regulator and membrane fusion protein Fig1-domain-containing protein n=1 Tax=Colletotrichum godetiae TaxID=1209918 RepID=A0AAJ0ANC1_9PEZI|nr:Ca2+ regulator and membrane fusion protein Fig1-domain-containing protein [Colletotrichum godetiae]KAK1676415.1 Ca2+ regulator and membrane fusion protein Fig1-domain-containing protein [Colletotrichum godetiae]
MPKFRLWWYRFVPVLGYHHVMMITLVFPIILLSVLLSGCTAENLNGLCLISLSYSSEPSGTSSNQTETGSNSNTTTADRPPLEVRVGYFGMCIKSMNQWVCSTNSRVLDSFAQRTQQGEGSDSALLTLAADRFREEIIFKGLLFAPIILGFFVIFLLSLFPSWHDSEESVASGREAVPTRAISILACFCTFFAAFLYLIAVFWQHLSSPAAISMGKAFTGGAVVGSVGTGAMSLGWISVFLLLCTSFGLLIMILSIRVLSQMLVEMEHRGD